MGVSERSSKAMRRTVRAVSAKEMAQADQASQEAMRPLILPTLRSSFLAPSVTISVYRKITCQVLRKPLRGSFMLCYGSIKRIHLGYMGEPRRANVRDSPTRLLSDVCLYPDTARGFFEGVCG